MNGSNSSRNPKLKRRYKRSYGKIEKVAHRNTSYQWLEMAGQKERTKALIMEAQEQGLSTRATDARI